MSIQVSEWGISLLLTFVAVVLVVIGFLYVGPLWRDEAAFLQVATLPDWNDVRQLFHFEAFPLAFHGLIRTLTAQIGTSDAALRSYGLVVSIALIAAHWFTSWMTTRRAPVVAMALIALNPTILSWAGSLRGYGLGCVMIVLTFAGFCQLIRKRTVGWSLFTLLTSILSVQCVIQNSMLILAMGLSAAFVGWRNKEIRTSILVLSIGFLSGLTVIPYLSNYGSGSKWAILIKVPMSSLDYLQRFINSCGGELLFFRILWVGIFIVTIAVGLKLLYRNPSAEDDPKAFKDQQSLIQFSLGSLSLGVLCFLEFLNYLSYPTQVWYYMMLMNLCVCSIATIFQTFTFANAKRRKGLMIAACLFAVCQIPLDLARLIERKSNVDLIAKAVEANEKPGDLVVISPWYIGCSFLWYYEGKGTWESIPPMPEIKMHRYDWVQEAMTAGSPMPLIKKQIQERLTRGETVWILGQMREPDPDGIDIPGPPPDPDTGWWSVRYQAAWSEELTEFLRSHAAEFTQVDLQLNQAVMKFENAELWKANGWKD
ncbi:hypothetical protein SH668x_000249 [Planctomicrobium sp. SH668]|uniref:hypothetical protein n=1 Tax=Planctomicrobium sp. SH668 TaxID=3448126 RepID=UPI003F5B99B7